jgi:hypothetical protein
MVNRVQARSAHAPKPLRAVLLLGGLALAGYWCFTYSGLYRLLAELQLGWWRKYYPTYTGLVVLIACLLPAAVVVQIIGSIREKERSREEADAAVASEVARRERLQYWLQHRRGRLMGALFTVMFAGVGVYFLASGLLAGDRVSVDARALEQGERPAGRYAEVTGRLLADEAVTVAEGRSHSEKVYIPVVSPEWRDGQPARVYLQTWPIKVSRDLAVDPGPYEGMLSANSLPGLVISSLAEQGRPVPDRYWVLQYRKTPKEHRELGVVMLTVAGFAAALTALAWAIGTRRERRAASRPAAGPSP